MTFPLENLPSDLSLLLVAGEASGDTHGAALVSELGRLIKGKLQVVGIGGDGLLEEGQEQLYHISQMQVTGIAEVAGRYRFFRNVLGHIVQEVKSRKPDLILLVDYPGFNLRLARELSPLGIPICHYSAPQAWAWREGRVRFLRRYVDKLIVLFPFETEFFARHGVSTEYYGHPLLSHIKGERALLQQRGVALSGEDSRRIIAYFPGSRANEVGRHMPAMAEVARQLGESYRHIIPLARSLSTPEQESFRREYGAFEITDDAEALLQAAEVGLIKTGTSTLQAALIGTPFIALYKAAPLSYVLGRLLAKVEYLSIVNILSGKSVVPEFIQDNLTPKQLLRALRDLLEHPERREEMKAEFANVAETLHGEAPYRDAAASIASMVPQSRKRKR